jgi:hypothetical protein
MSVLTAEHTKKAIAILGWCAFTVSMAGYIYFGKKEISSGVSVKDKKRTAGLTASAYIGGFGTATLITYGLMK